ncbi:MAG: non-heme iron oxygenase ferredoxin subunit [Armatimonadota bacterium]|nr:non-heme iron oxygenase ferredoxin subunit [Armatimonadota bacterium]MDR7401522.1 non-heme iron oxygenase ferredoxin subunit [Armatimonadota bacterium]MDR7404347.1 non-heme iron oxygenase ferredoxin subunit [Armatimonadota bacterium]MDR7437666.1 non-heme iron oxygenase ferredoxin subunit [Armatimonadota bacterium]MDR7471670.1 non-heme iron oxygenase ferredoxin subunit [Armatimonadota bacterium]
MTGATSEFVPVAAVDEIPPGTARVVTLEGRRIAVFNVGGTYYAIDDTCTHEEASLASGALYGDIVACPRHGSRFHLPTGRVLSLPAVIPVNTYPVQVADGQVCVQPVPRRGRGMPHKT